VVVRHRVGFQASWRIAVRTSSVWWNVVPILPAISWWLRGVPDDKMRMMEQPTLWERHLRRDRSESN
jgi:hypothetical protein